MPGSGVSGYAAIVSRVRVMYSELLTANDLAELNEAPDYNQLINQLKRTPYGPYLDRVKDKELSPRRAAFQLRGRLAEDYTSIIRMAPPHTRPLLAQLYRHFEIDNLKAVLRGIIGGASWDRIRFVLFPTGDMGVLPAMSMVEVANVPAAIEMLRDTPYYETLSFAMRRYSVEQNLFPLEVALDLNYWRKLWSAMNALTGQDRTQALRIIGSLVDMNNLMWAIRYRVYHHLSEEELINYTLPFGFRVQDRDVRAVAAGADIGQIVSRIYPELPDVDTLLQEPRKGLPQLEVLLQRRVVEQCRSAFVGDPFHIGLLLAYLVLEEFEIQDLTMLIEGKSTQMPIEEFRSFSQMGTLSR